MAKRARKNVLNILFLLMVILFVSVIIAFTFGASLMNAFANKTSVNNFVVSRNVTIFNLAGINYSVYLENVLPNSGVAEIRIGKLPVLFNKELNVTLNAGHVAAINSSGVGKYADMEIKLINLTNNTATIDIKEINLSFYVPVSTTPIQSNSSSTTIPQVNQNSSTKTTSTTTSATTTIKSNSTYIGIIDTLKTNATYALMLNYSSEVNNSAECTASLYNSTYLKMKGSLPKGSMTYKNNTAISPYRVEFNVSDIGSGNYAANFITVSHEKITSGIMMQFIVNPANGDVSKVKFEGIAAGMNYSQLNSIYDNATSSGNACGILIS